MKWWTSRQNSDISTNNDWDDEYKQNQGNRTDKWDTIAWIDEQTKPKHDQMYWKQLREIKGQSMKQKGPVTRH